MTVKYYYADDSVAYEAPKNHIAFTDNTIKYAILNEELPVDNPGFDDVAYKAKCLKDNKDISKHLLLDSDWTQYPDVLEDEFITADKVAEFKTWRSLVRSKVNLNTPVDWESIKELRPV